VIFEAELIAKSKRNAFYAIRIVEHCGNYTVEKESGINGKVCDRRTWPMKNRETAIKFFNRKIKQKMNPARGSPRVYKKKRSAGQRTA
jgi:hypothetical protein